MIIIKANTPQELLEELAKLLDYNAQVERSHLHTVARVRDKQRIENRAEAYEATAHLFRTGIMIEDKLVVVDPS